ncbi:AmmeMemoRadiSam system protein B [Candidatus Falkowbacteria bacterium RIFOXYB2_FULL_38_15]|uniref:AmmeMemoRadiSam system protein B n=1 Tax=Candidatus Falkowbacteria bacterium RIFOXYA2_FULL_38_12 TaxID=1797993 RepID=A0A1F5S5M7_9BACT|nr:MAG: AmmeMemoRadiSam system protein B [Candidatus Falkowbacteria bacterium RIFOXYA2_FULL_38_12]OGF33734.1 MAG: AmmeMemoRadiSam system protein B [Candidatus Falkowbacteria bacterium RIFOXYB2_FULL_38_15]OGF42397.1 MAG: AmmeMemoRadiSam system protein B [Candidatus Falkowbacteria bacterium RIFOXYD2_FULL_39_16]
MLVFAAITPHPPILIPSIGKENLKRIKKTENAMTELEKKIFESGAETIIVISPHGQILPDAFSVNLNPEYEINLEEFGDFGTKTKYKTNTRLAYKIKELAESQNIPVILNSDQYLDHGSAIPLSYLTKRLKNVSILPIGYSLLDLKAHYSFGDFLKEIILDDDKKIAVIASGDLSHCVTKDAPAGYSPRGKEFDEKLVELITNKNITGILKIDQGLIEEAGECGLRSIMILLGLLERINYTPEILSYEAPFGVGYLVANFKLN